MKFHCPRVHRGYGLCSQGKGHSWNHSPLCMGVEEMRGRGVENCPGPTNTPEMITADGKRTQSGLTVTWGQLVAKRGDQSSPGALQGPGSHWAVELHLPLDPPGRATVLHKQREPGLGAGSPCHTGPCTSALLAGKWGHIVHLVGWRRFDEVTSAGWTAPCTQMH